MLLAIDVGNTNMVFGLIEGDALTGSFRLMTDANRTSDEIGLAAWDYFQRFGLKTEDVEDVIIASVVPQVMHTLSNAIIKYFNKTPIIVDDGVDPGLPYGVSGDERLGPDRAVACIGAMAKYGAPLIVLDFGTATTLDAVNQAGEYMAACITAGVRIAATLCLRRPPCCLRWSWSNRTRFWAALQWDRSRPEQWSAISAPWNTSSGRQNGSWAAAISGWWLPADWPG
jgi:type III pantothenate kinase